VNKFLIAAIVAFGVLFAMLIVTSIQQSFAGAAVLVAIIIASIAFLITGVIYFVYWWQKIKLKS
jgi:hypothetical protein